MSFHSGPVLTFNYDALSRLTTTTGEGLTRTYNYALDDRPTAERTQFGAPGISQIARAKRYDYGPSGLLSIQQGETALTYPLTDEHGSILGQATEAGELTEARDYGPFGEELVGPTQPDPADPLADQSFDYLGAHGRAGVYGSEQIHMGARIYDPQSGRFISRDPLPGVPGNPQTQNPYAYGLGSPGRYYDLDGRFAIAIPVVIEVGILIGVTAGTVWCATNGDQCAEYNEDLYEKGEEAVQEIDEAISKDPKSGESGGRGGGNFKPGKGGPRNENPWKPKATDPRLKRILDQLYRDADELPGGTGGAIRREGTPNGQHVQKGRERIRQLDKLLRKRDLSQRDREIAQDVRDDLDNALKEVGAR